MLSTCHYEVRRAIVNISSKIRDSTNICYYKNLDLIRINDYKNLDSTRTI